MRRAVLVLWVLVLCAPAFGDSPTSDAAVIEKQMRDDVAAVSAEAAAAWDEGNAARDANDVAKATAAYRKVIALAPRLDHPHRRLCGVLAVNDIDAGIRECETALSLAPSSGFDKLSLAAALLKRGQPADRPRAAELAHAAVVALPSDVYAAQIDCTARGLSDDVEGVSACVDHLLALAPNDALGNYLAAGLAATKGDVTWASIYLERAKDGGLSPELYAKARGKLDAMRPKERSSTSAVETFAIIVPILGGWILLLIALLVAGNILSDRTQRSVDHDVGIRRTYRAVLLLVGVLFYASLPLLIAVVVVGGFAVIEVFDDMGATPIIVLLLVGGIMISTIAAVARSLFAKRRLTTDGDPVDPAANPELKRVLDEVAAAVGTRPIDLVYLTPGTDIAVTEAGTERRLILGVGLFHGMKQRELRVLLAHEYGLFRNNAVGGALSVRRSLNELIAGIGRSRVPNVINPAWWFVRAYTHLYNVVSTGASRLQEALADRSAIRAYGSEAFIASARHVVAREVEFSQDLTQTIKDVVDNKWSLPNLYTYDPEHKKSPAERQADIAKRLDREPQRFDSRPSWRQRIDAAARLALPGEVTCADGDAPVWSLFPDPERVERAMTAIIRTRIRTKLGVTISDAEWTDDDPADEPAA